MCIALNRRHELENGWSAVDMRSIKGVDAPETTLVNSLVCHLGHNLLITFISNFLQRPQQMIVIIWVMNHLGIRNQFIDSFDLLQLG